MRAFHRFTYRDADYRISSADISTVINTIKTQRNILENFVHNNQVFLTSLDPVPLLPETAPDIAVLMQQAGALTSVGPMAAVAGAIAQLGAESGYGTMDELKSITGESIVENGGDIYMILRNEFVLGIHSGVKTLEGKLAFRILPDDTPLAVCSSSSTMGHSLSLGHCNLATVFSKSGALADAAATRACNMVKTPDDIEYVLDEISAIQGIIGLLLIKGDKVGLAGDIPEIVSNADPEIMNKITRYGHNAPSIQLL